MQDAPKEVWSIPYVSVAFFPSLKLNFIAYCSSSCPDCIFEIHQLWQSAFSRVHSNCCRSCSFEAEIIKIGQSSHKMYSNNIVNFQESTTILNACTKKSGNLLNAPHTTIDTPKQTTHAFTHPRHPKFLELYPDYYPITNQASKKDTALIQSSLYAVGEGWSRSHCPNVQDKIITTLTGSTAQLTSNWLTKICQWANQYIFTLA